MKGDNLESVNGELAGYIIRKGQPEKNEYSPCHLGEGRHVRMPFQCHRKFHTDDT